MPSDPFLEEKLQSAIREILPLHLRIYDFGESTKMPEPPTDFPGQRSYLTTTCCILEDSARSKYLAVELNFRRGADRKDLLESSDILNQLAKAVPLFDEQSSASLDDAIQRKLRVR